MDRINERLAKARRRYKEKLIGSLDELEELLRTGHDSRDALAEAQRLAHKICGSAGTFGFAGVSEAIGAMDRDLLALLSGQVQQTGELWRRVEQQMEKARELD